MCQSCCIAFVVFARSFLKHRKKRVVFCISVNNATAGVGELFGCYSDCKDECSLVMMA